MHCDYATSALSSCPPFTEGDCSRKGMVVEMFAHKREHPQNLPLIKTTPLGLGASIIGGGVRKNGMIEMWQPI
ncbi:hypothetical protein CEXT_420431 [Caerostris extrusa]|uniref:Uncharacterized protein n=1 Tax=Caerostris extrusa TaxID=172846 RepID=A0AAV4PNR6_CAEEX|nr:hypothetical protein CEXT_420431 [Caerostris extrusa]